MSTPPAFRLLAGLMLIVCLAAGASIATAAEDDLFISASGAFHADDYTDAVDGLSRYLERTPDGPRATEARLLLGRAYFELGRYADALVELRHALGPEGSPRTADTIYWVGEALLRQGDADEARAAFEQVLVQFPASPYAPFARFSIAWSYWHAGRWAEALPAFQAVIEQFPQDPLRIDAQCRAGECLIRLNHPDEAIRLLNDFVTAYPVTSLAPQAHYLLAEAQMTRQHYGAAREAYGKAAAQRGPWAPYALAGAGLAAFAEQQYAASLEAFTDYLERYPRGPQQDQVQFYLGRAQAALGQLKPAIETWARLVAQAPASPWVDDALLWQGEIWARRGRFEEAADCFRRLIDRDPDSPLAADARYALGCAQWQGGALDAAVRTFETVAARNPSLRQQASALLRAADVAMRRGAYAEAAARYDRVLETAHDPPYADYAQYQLGRALMAQGQMDAAALAFDALLNRFPDSALRARAQWLASQASARRSAALGSLMREIS